MARDLRHFAARVVNETATRTQTMNGKPEECPGCGQEIDPETCWCGDRMDAHFGWEGHPAVPMGCDCMRVTEDTADG